MARSFIKFENGRSHVAVSRRGRHQRCSVFKIFDNVVELVRLESELRHGRMSCGNAFGQAPAQRLDRDLGEQRAERRRNR